MPEANAANGSTRPSALYAAGIQADEWQSDPEQLTVLVELDRIHDAVLARCARGNALARLMRMFAPRPPVPGLYLWGSVGRGKTFLTELMFENIPLAGKRRLHFHRFMAEAHQRLHGLSRQRDPLHRVARDIAETTRLLVLDECAVNDIGDAMLLGRLLTLLFAHGVTLVTTSNIAPQELYKDGLQRAQFLPAIAQIQHHCRVLQLESPHDYRLRHLVQASTYHLITADLITADLIASDLIGSNLVAAEVIGEDAHAEVGRADDSVCEARLRASFDQLTIGMPKSAAHAQPPPLQVNARPIAVKARADGIAWFDFTDLCDGPRAVADYIELAREFHTVMLSHVPVFGIEHEDAAKRFILLVDELYDRRVNLLLSAAAAPDALYRGRRHRTEFARTSSRLVEMQSADYLALEHRP